MPESAISTVPPADPKGSGMVTQVYRSRNNAGNSAAFNDLEKALLYQQMSAVRSGLVAPGSPGTRLVDIKSQVGLLRQQHFMEGMLRARNQLLIGDQEGATKNFLEAMSGGVANGRDFVAQSINGRIVLRATDAQGNPIAPGVIPAPKGQPQPSIEGYDAEAIDKLIEKFKDPAVWGYFNHEYDIQRREQERLDRELAARKENWEGTLAETTRANQAGEGLERERNAAAAEANRLRAAANQLTLDYNNARLALEAEKLNRQPTAEQEQKLYDLQLNKANAELQLAKYEFDQAKLKGTEKDLNELKAKITEFDPEYDADAEKNEPEPWSPEFLQAATMHGTPLIEARMETFWRNSRVQGDPISSADALEMAVFEIMGNDSGSGYIVKVIDSEHSPTGYFKVIQNPNKTKQQEIPITSEEAARLRAAAAKNNPAPAPTPPSAPAVSAPTRPAAIPNVPYSGGPQP